MLSVSKLSHKFWVDARWDVRRLIPCPDDTIGRSREGFMSCPLRDTSGGRLGNHLTEAVIDTSPNGHLRWFQFSTSSQPLRYLVSAQFSYEHRASMVSNNLLLLNEADVSIQYRFPGIMV